MFGGIITDYLFHQQGVASGAEYAANLLHSFTVLGHAVEDVGADHEVEAVIGIGYLCDIYLVSGAMGIKVGIDVFSHLRGIPEEGSEPFYRGKVEHPNGLRYLFEHYFAEIHAHNTGAFQRQAVWALDVLPYLYLAVREKPTRTLSATAAGVAASA